ncbi:MAG: zf-HC2 domain-containing protein [Oscillospiraceae bacterium]|jgi:hypothetical protein|nr:zf-HC2 domain-containing protein [Oscillospiraceae bacterium]
MNYDCELIQDLIPLVKDGVASEKSAEAVAEHTKECPVCREMAETEPQIAMPPLRESENSELSKVTTYKTRIKKRRKLIIALAVLCAIVLAVGSGLVAVQVAKFLVKGESYTTRDIAEYGNYSGHIEAEREGFLSLLEIFPKAIPQSAKAEDYYYFCNNGMLDNSYQLYLLCAYDEGDFALEKARLESIELTLRDEIHRPAITDTGFNYCAVVTIFGYKDSFEYALIDSTTKTIAYVFAQSMGIDNEIVPQKYRPQGFQPPREALNEFGSYHFYQFKIGDGYYIPGIDNIS